MNQWDVVKLGPWTLPPEDGMGYAHAECVSSVQIDKGKQSVKGKNKGTTTMQGSPAFPVVIRYRFLFERYHRLVEPFLAAIDPSKNRAPMAIYYPDLVPRNVAVVVVERVGAVKPPEGGLGICEVEITCIEWNPPPPKAPGVGKIGKGELEGAELAKFNQLIGSNTPNGLLPAVVGAGKIVGQSAQKVAPKLAAWGNSTLFGGRWQPFGGAGGGSSP